MKRNDVLRILHKERKDLVDRYNISLLSVFGSVARDDARQEAQAVDVLLVDLDTLDKELGGT